MEFFASDQRWYEDIPGTSGLNCQQKSTEFETMEMKSRGVTTRQ